MTVPPASAREQETEWAAVIREAIGLDEGISAATQHAVAEAHSALAALLAEVEQHREERDELRRRVNGG